MAKSLKANIHLFIVCTLLGMILNGCEKDEAEPSNTLSPIKYALEIYPNPSTGIFYLDSAITIKESSLFNIMGQKINVKVQNNSLNLLNYPAGIYLLQATDENGNVSVSKLIKTQKDNLQ